MKRRLFSAALSIILLPVLAMAAECPPPPEEAKVRSVQDGTLMLQDGRTIRSAGVELTAAGRKQLATLAAGKTITLRPIGRVDRWGRQPAHLDTIEKSLLENGLGHVARQARDACLEPLFLAEEKGRLLKAGLWAEPARHVLDARNGADLEKHLGKHVLAEGEIVSARLYQSRVYLNFARYWKSGLSLIISEKQWPLFARGAAIDSLPGTRIRARGRLEYRLGPAIIVDDEDRLEIIDR